MDLEKTETQNNKWQEQLKILNNNVNNLKFLFEENEPKQANNQTNTNNELENNQTEKEEKIQLSLELNNNTEKNSTKKVNNKKTNKRKKNKSKNQEITLEEKKFNYCNWLDDTLHQFDITDYTMSEWREQQEIVHNYRNKVKNTSNEKDIKHFQNIAKNQLEILDKKIKLKNSKKKYQNENYINYYTYYQ